jgi:AraC-like DNA-binding protein
MIYQTYVPRPPLDRFIKNLWYWEGDEPGHAKDTIMASSRMGILINLKSDELFWYGGEEFAQKNNLKGIALCGTHSSAFAINAHQPHMMGVQFRPGGAFPFFRATQQEFEDRHISLENLWGADAGRLHQRLVQALAPEDKFAILEQAMIDKAERGFEHHPVVALALTRLSAGRPLSVAALAAEAEVSHKRFIHLFTGEVGFAPKRFLRVMRFQKLLERVWDAPVVDWAEMAALYGYYDQPHLIRDFREFSGFTPSEYMRVRGPFQQHVPLRA